MLILLRKEGEVTFGGYELDTYAPAQTADHSIAIKELHHGKFQQHIVVEVGFRDGTVIEKKLYPSVGGISIDRDLEVMFLGSRRVVLANGEEELVARVGFEAPKSYAIMRDNARKGKAA